MGPDDAILSLRAVDKTYGKGPSAVDALRDVTIDVERSSFTAVMGPSGSGKSTFLQSAGGWRGPRPDPFDLEPWS